MLQINWYSLFYDIIAYFIATCGLIDEVLYKLGLRRRLNFCEDIANKLTGHVAIVTGGTRGLGLTVVRTLISRGCFVFVASSQTKDKFPRIMDKIVSSIPEVDPVTGIERGKVSLHTLDLSSMDSVKSFVEAFKSMNMHLNYLICNAGIMFAPRRLTIDGFESHLAINHLGHSLMILELLALLRRTADDAQIESRIVSVSSSEHKITRFRFDDITGEVNYSSAQAYGQSKLAQIMFTMKLSRFLRKDLGWDNVQAITLHPAIVLSELYEHVNLIKYFPFLVPIIRFFTRDEIQGAETTIYATLSPELKGTSGVYLENCAIKQPSLSARKVEDQEKLWEITLKLLEPWISKNDTTRLAGLI